MERSIAFDRIADRYDATRGGEQRGRGFAADVLARLPEGRVLEVGIGTGSIAEPMRESGRTVVGVDISRPMLEHAVARLGSVVAQADAQSLPIATASVRAVASIWVLHVVADVHAVLAEVARVLAPGGRFVTITSRGWHEPTDDIDAAYDEAGPPPPRKDGADDVLAHASSVGLVLVEHTSTEPQTYERSPVEEARRSEQRLHSHTFDMDDETFAREVQPKIDALRAPRPGPAPHPVRPPRPLRVRDLG